MKSYILPTTTMPSATTLDLARDRFTIRRIAIPFLVACLVITILASNVYGSGTVPVLTTTCSTLSPSITPVIGNLGTVLFTCGTQSAFTVNMSGSATPSFQLPVGYVTLMIVPHVPNSQKCGLGTVLEAGEPTKFHTNDSFDYCAVYFTLPGNILSPFTLTWSQNQDTNS